MFCIVSNSEAWEYLIAGEFGSALIPSLLLVLPLPSKLLTQWKSVYFPERRKFCQGIPSSCNSRRAIEHDFKVPCLMSY